MKNKKILILFVVCLLLIIYSIIFSFNYTKVENELSKNNKNVMRETSLKKRFLMEKQLRGKDLKVLPKIIPADEINTEEEKIILLYSGFDCSTCVRKAFKLVTKIKNLYPLKKIFIIASNTNIGRDQLENQYYKFIYFDENEIIRQYLKFIYTPVFLSVDNNFEIKDVYFPNVFDNVGEDTLLGDLWNISSISTKK